jgi:hypothetical protein
MIWVPHRRKIILLLFVVLTWVAVSTPAVATTMAAGERGNYRGQCRRLTKQIAHYRGTVMPMARARGNAMWARATTEHLDRIWNRRADLCPRYGRERTMIAKMAAQAQQFRKNLAMAGKAAASFFTGGLSGLMGP